MAESRRRNLPERLFDRVVGSVVPPIVDHVDVDDVLERVDVDELLARIDLNAVLDRVDPDRLLDRVDPNRLLDRVDPNRLLDRVDPNRLLARVDPDRLLDRVDPDRLLDRVDPDRLLDRVDPDRLLDRVDANRLMERVDVNQLVERTELGAIIARSTSGVFTRLVDVARVQVTAVDLVVQGLAGRVVRRARRETPGRPGAPDDAPELPRGDRWRRASLLQGHFADAVSRFLAFSVDQFVLAVLYAIGTVLVGSAFEVVVGRTLDLSEARWLVTATYAVWSFVYVAGQLALSGRTVGKALLGLTVVRADGGALEPWRAAVRTLVFPVSFLLAGAGFLIGVLRRDRRQLHDLIAGTAVVYDWDAATARTRAEPVPASRWAVIDNEP